VRHLATRETIDRSPIPAQLHHLRTARQNILVAGPQSVEMGNENSARALIAVLPDCHRQCVFLLSPTLAPIEIRGDSLASPAISAFRLQTSIPGQMRLRHPLSAQRFVGVTQPGAGGPNGCVIFDSPGTGDREQFTTLPVNAAHLSGSFVRTVNELCAATAPPFTAATFLQRLREAAFRPHLAEPVMRLLPRGELAALAKFLLHSHEDLAVLRHALPANPWFAQILPNLQAWHAAPEKSPARILYSPAADEFAGDAFEGFDRPQAGLAVTGLARACIHPQKFACLLATVRNEGAYFLEWLAYHRCIGFEHAVIYTNDNTDGSVPLLETLASHGIITLIHNEAGRRCAVQNKMHAHALSLLPDILDYRWAALIDADEFVAFDTNRFGSLHDILAWHETQPIDALALCWAMFVAGSDHRHTLPSTLHHFTRREPAANLHVKTLFRPQKFCNARPHFPFATLGMHFYYRSEFGALHHHPGVASRDPSFATHASVDTAWINHYSLRTAPELLWKIARGHPDAVGPAQERYMAMASKLFGKFITLSARNDLIEDRRIFACAKMLPAELSSLRALPGIAAAEARTRAIFTARVQNLVQEFLNNAPRHGKEPAEFSQFRELLKNAQYEPQALRATAAR
jgi:hypothetical protein